MYEKFEQLMKEKGVTPADVSKATGIGKSSLTGWKNGSYTPKADKLYAISKYFGVPMEYFFDEEDSLERYMEQARRDFESSLEEDYARIEGRPLFRASAGSGAFNDTYANETIEADDRYEYATVVGDSMSPVLLDGDIIKIEPTSETSPRDYTLIKINGDDCTVKFVEVVENGIWVKAVNKEVFADRFYTIQDVLSLPITIIGKVVSFERKLK